MFQDAAAFNGEILFVTSNVVDLASMFKNAVSYHQDVAEHGHEKGQAF